MFWRSASVLMLGLAANGCIFSLDGGLLALNDAGQDGAADASADIEVAEASADQGQDLADAAGDMQPLGQLVCSQPSQVGVNSVNLSEPSIRIDGLQIFSDLLGGTQGYQLTRGSTMDDFVGSWTEQSVIPSNAEDPSFVMAQGVEAVVYAQGPNPRSLKVCSSVPNPGPCSSVVVRDAATQQVLTGDIDGPSVRKIGSKFYMAFNSGPHIYVAETTDVTLQQWDAVAQTNINSGPTDNDDPSLSPDGKMLIWGRNQSGGTPSDIFVAYRDTLSDQFDNITLLGSVSGAADEAGPELFQVGARSYELYFYRDVSPYRIFVAECSR